jgi:pyruvate/2-oxoglutarate dehydrogenase complex dihydrolipoamide acyltransferase (E2) component
MTDVIVPRLGVTVTEVTIVEWLVADGEAVTPGQPILTVATDKTEAEIEATCAGVLTHGVGPEETCEVGAVIGTIQ